MCSEKGNGIESLVHTCISHIVNGMLKNIPKKTLLTWGTCDSQLSSVRCRSTELSSQTSTPKTFVALCDDPCIRSDSADLLDFDGTYYRSAKVRLKL